MSAKPTPGPVTFHEFEQGVSLRMDDVEGVNIPIATFWDGDVFQEPNRERAVKFARAWVEGMDAMGKLDRIRLAFDEPLLEGEELLKRISQILDEAKP